MQMNERLYLAQPASFGHSGFATLALPIGVTLPPARTFDVFDGTSGDDSLTGTDGDDTFNMADGGHDVVHGEGGDDVFNFGATFESQDAVFGGGGYDTLVLDGSNYVFHFEIRPSMLNNIEDIQLTGGYRYEVYLVGETREKLTTIDATDTSHLTADCHDANVHVIGSDFQDFIYLGWGESKVDARGGDDLIYLGRGRLELHAGDGNDTVICDSDLSESDRLKGGTGHDTATFFAESITLKNGTLKGFEVFDFEGNASSHVVTADGTVAAGEALTVDGRLIGGEGDRGHTFTFDGSAETDGSFDITGGGGDDVLTGGALDDHIVGGDHGDVISGGGGADALEGGLGKDTFVCADVADSTGIARDTVIDFVAKDDKFDLPVAVGGMDEPIVAGSLSVATFDADMEAAVGAANLDIGLAVLFTPSEGDLAGRIFLAIDANGTAGYQTGADFLIELSSPDDLNFTTANFI